MTIDIKEQILVHAVSRDSIPLLSQGNIFHMNYTKQNSKQTSCNFRELKLSLTFENHELQQWT